MPGEEIYELYIDAFTPQTIPMARLAGYMISFAELLGHREHVHFGDLKEGSLAVAARVDEVAQRKVEKRVEEIRYGVGPEIARKALREIDDKLAEDHAVGCVLRGKAKLIEFPGRTRPVEAKLGPVEQPGALDGEIIQVGGRDETINVHLKAGDQIHFCVTSKEARAAVGPTHLWRPGARARKRDLGSNGIGRLDSEEIRDRRIRNARRDVSVEDVRGFASAPRAARRRPDESGRSDAPVARRVTPGW